MGQTHSTHDAYKKIIAQEKLTLPVGSEVERLFYEDFKYDVDAKVITTPTTPAIEYDPALFDPALRRQSSLKPSSTADLRRQSSLQPSSSATADEPPALRRKSSFQPSATSTAEDKWAPITPSTSSSSGKRMSQKDRLKYFSPGAAPELSSTNFLSPQAALRRSLSDPARGSQSSSNSNESSMGKGEERWKERMRRRIADRQASDEQKARLSRASGMSAWSGGSGLSSDLSPEEEG